MYFNIDLIQVLGLLLYYPPVIFGFIKNYGFELGILEIT